MLHICEGQHFPGQNPLYTVSVEKRGEKRRKEEKGGEKRRKEESCQCGEKRRKEESPPETREPWTLDPKPWTLTVQVSGQKFYYLRNAAALLEMALVNWALQVGIRAQGLQVGIRAQGIQVGISQGIRGLGV